MVDYVSGDASEKVEIGVDVVPQAAKLQKFVNGEDVASHDAFCKV